MQAFAHNSGLEFEYSIAGRLVTFHRSVLSQDSSAGNHGSTNLDLPDLSSHWPVGSVATDNRFGSNFLDSAAQNSSGTLDNGQSSVDIGDIGAATGLPLYLTNGEPATNKSTSMDTFVDTFLDNFNAVSQSLSSDAAVSDHDKHIFSTGLTATDVDWSHYGDLDLNDFASSDFSQGQSLTGFGEGVDYRYNESNSSNFQMAGYHRNSASNRSHESRSYPGIMFDSGSIYSSQASDASHTSLASVKSGRTVPLSAMAKASMKAPRKVGSC